jgi:hypothetical protein
MEIISPYGTPMIRALALNLNMLNAYAELATDITSTPSS